MSMTRAAAIENARAYFDRGDYVRDLARRVAFRTESQEPGREAELLGYLTKDLQPALERMGFACRLIDNPAAGKGPFLYAERLEDPKLTTVLSYGHGDVIRGLEPQWRAGLNPWEVKQEGDRLYGRGTADNKGQHSVNLGAVAAVLKARGKLGFNLKLMIETGEEIGSPGLRQFCEMHQDLLRADVFVASDGPRVAPNRPTLFLGSRGALNFDITIDLRAGGHHSGNWGGLLANPAIILAHAIASIADAKGKVLLPDLLPQEIPPSVRKALAGLTVEGGDDAPAIDTDWGEPGLSTPEKVYGWNTFEVLAMTAGNPENPVNAIPPRASAHCQIRFVAGTDPNSFVPAIQRHLGKKGFGMATVERAKKGFLAATRLDPDHPWVHWAVDSITRTTDKIPAVLPNLGGSLPNDCFADVLGLPTLWVPHSYAACSQHAPNEHLLLPLAREGLEIMAGLFWDLGEPGTPKG
jgi:acetylornithine deacetylase/succinyl-diaminopimelate desuccinylase-like protein